MKKKFLLMAFAVSIIFNSYSGDISSMHHKRFNEVSFIEMHNISRYYESGWPYPSPTGNQNLSVSQALEYSKAHGAILSIKIPAHWTFDYGNGKGKGPIMAAHGMYRRTFDDDYFADGKNFIQNAIHEIDQEFARLATIPGVAQAIAPMKKKYDQYKGIVDGYLYWEKPIADMDRVARHVTFGSDEKAAIVPFTPCLVDPSARPYLQVLAEIKQFLDNDRDQMVILKIENVTYGTDDITPLFAQAELTDYIHKQDKNALWPTIGELIASNKRFVPFITTHVPEDNPYLNAESDFIWHTGWNFQTKAELLADHTVPTDNPNYHRWITGKPIANALFRLPCHLTQGFGGRPDLAAQVNTKEVITKHMENIGAGKPTFLAIDFIDIGDGFEVVRQWNAENDDARNNDEHSVQMMYKMFFRQ